MYSSDWDYLVGPVVGRLSGVGLVILWGPLLAVVFRLQKVRRGKCSQ